MSRIRLIAYQLSVKDVQRLIERFPVFASAELTEEAIRQGAFQDLSKNAGWYFTRNAAEGKLVTYVGLTGWCISYLASNSSTGLRYGLRIDYDPKSPVMKTLRCERKRGYAWDTESGTKILTAGKAPVVTFGGIDYIWVNRELCESGMVGEMELVTLKLVARATPYSRNNESNDYKDAKELQFQTQVVALSKCTEAERNMIHPIDLTDEDDYMNARPTAMTMRERKAFIDSLLPPVQDKAQQTEPQRELVHTTSPYGEGK